MNNNISSKEVYLTEEWRDVPGFEGYFQISNKGNVKRLSRVVNGKVYIESIVQPNIGRYIQVSLSANGKRRRFLVHRLVAMAFISNPNEYGYVNHIDENKHNNHVDNLEWCTQKHNCNHGTRTARIKSNMPQNKKVIQLTMDGEFVAEYPTIQDAARQTRICAGHICDVCKGNREFANGFKWRYKDPALFALAQTALASKQSKSTQSRKDKFIILSRKVAQYDSSGTLIRVFNGMREMAEEFGYCKPSIINCCNGKSKTAYGYIWKYAE